MCRGVLFGELYALCGCIGYAHFPLTPHPTESHTPPNRFKPNLTEQQIRALRKANSQLIEWCVVFSRICHR